MADKHSVSDAVLGAPDKIMSFETGQLAGLADGAVLAQLGNTMVLVTATASDKPREGASFFPLTVVDDFSVAAIDNAINDLRKEIVVVLESLE